MHMTVCVNIHSSMLIDVPLNIALSMPGYCVSMSSTHRGTDGDGDSLRFSSKRVRSSVQTVGSAWSRAGAGDADGNHLYMKIA